MLASIRALWMLEILFMSGQDSLHASECWHMLSLVFSQRA